MFQRSFVTQLTDVRDPNTEQVDPLGTLRFKNGVWYKYVALDATTQSADVDADAGDWCVYSDYENNEVVFDKTDGQGVDAGVVQATVDASASAGYRFWIAIQGLQSVDQDLSALASIANGDILTGNGGADLVLVRRNADTEQGCAIVHDNVNDKLIVTCPF